jgi:DNA-3-methyladenine glycosylase
LVILDYKFYQRDDVVRIAKELLGKTLCTKIDEKLCGGIITETEAYAGIHDKASHAYGGRRSERTEIMYQKGGTAYVYLCYGVHSLFNVVTNKKDIPDAVLIRGIAPVTGTEFMLQRTGKKTLDKNFSIGPGKVSKALGIHYSHTGIDLCGDTIWLEDTGIIVHEDEIKTGTRIGVNYAGEDALLPYRFIFINYQK